MSDEARFKDMVSAVTRELERCGLRSVSKPMPAPNDCGGWCAKLAFWRRDRPAVSVWFDRSVGRRLEFWFGFRSNNRDKLDRLVDELPSGTYAHLEDDDYRFLEGENYWHLNETAVRRVREYLGLTVEHDSDGHFLGANECHFQTNSDEQLALKAAEFISEIVERVDPLLLEERDIRDLDRSDTEYRSLVLARRGQGEFRRRVEAKWNNKCAVLKWRVPQVLRASHIKPWKDSDNRQRLDGDNGLLLSASLDALFDKMLITFDESGGIMISRRLASDDRKELMLDGLKLLKRPTKAQNCYLEFHRRQFHHKSESWIGQS